MSSTQRICLDCPKPISTQSVQGRCRVCAIAKMNADPEYRERRAEANRRKAKDPAFRIKMLRNIHAANAAWRNTPEGRESLRDSARRAAALFRTSPKAKAKWLATRASAGRKRSETVMAWCPPEYRDEYRRLRESRKMRAKAAKAFILAKLTPFERQMQALRNGARLVEMPVRRSTAPDFTLGGVTDWAA